MRCLGFAVLLVVAGCHLRAGFDAASRANGPLQAAMASSSVSRSDGVLNLPPQAGRNYALETGFGNSTLTVNGMMVVHDVTSTSFTPGAGYLATTLGANVRWEAYHWKGLSPTLAAGPARILLLDRSSGDRIWGNAVRGAAGLQFQLGPIAIYGDLYHEMAAFSRGPATGTTTIQGLTFGLAVQP
ncbi:MAG TPA: hypothetical protein VHW23_25050 [Kofleriaceae bacterium]|jgi:hypothetical protein|nr:hypothetical protein [Kofleriaceae bacterium]